MNEIVEKLTAHGIAPTPQRVEIAAVLLARPQHLSADQVLSLVNRDKPTVSKATVYNTLGLFSARNLIRQVVVDPTKVFYDSTVTPHHHFYNAATGELTDVELNTVNIARTPAPPANTEVECIDVVIRVRPVEPRR